MVAIYNTTKKIMISEESRQLAAITLVVDDAVVN
jgi:hypothetical protein